MLSRTLLFATLTGFLAAGTAGLAFGFSSGTMFQLFLSTGWSALFASLLNLGGLIGSILCGYFISNYGRRWTLFCACGIGLIGWVWLRISATTVHERYGPTVLFLAGRIMTGVSAGLIIPASGTYLVEISPSALYSIFGMLTQVGIVSGIAFAFVLGAIFAWDTVALLNSLSLAIVLVMCALTPESPKWLTKMGHVAQGSTVNTQLYGAGVEVEPLKGEDIEAPRVYRTRDYFLPCLAVPENQRSRLRITVLLMILQQFTGINAILFYAENVCLFGGIPVPSACAVMLGIFQVVFTVLGAFMIRYFSRQRLLQLSALIMCVAHFGFAVSVVAMFTYSKFTILGKLCTVLFLLGFSIGWGPLPVLIVMDLFKVSTRGFAISTGVAFNWISSFFVTFCFEILSVYIGTAALFWVFSVFCLLCFIFATRYIPKSLSQDGL